jgi:DNA replication protein DnaC
LACALGHKACREGFSVLYKRASRLFTDLAQARGEGRLLRLMTTLERTRLLIIDDWGPEPLNAEQRRDLLEIADDRCDRGSLLITSQVPVNRWHEVIGDPTTSWCLLLRKSCASYLYSQLNDLRVRKVDLPRHSFGDLVAG